MKHIQINVVLWILKKLEKKDAYLGRQVKRGLFEIKEELLINADVNAFINILKKVSINGDLDITNVVENL